MKILILGRNRINMHNWGHELWKQEIARQHDVRFFGPDYDGDDHRERGAVDAWDGTDIHRIIDKLEFEPDLIYTHLGSDVGKKIALDETNIPKVHWTCDYFYWMYKIEDWFIKKCKPDLVLLTNIPLVDRMSSRKGINTRLLPFSVNIDVFKPKDMDQSISVSAVMHADGNYYQREDILRYVSEIEGSYTLKALGQRKLLHDKYVNLHVESKIAIVGCRFYLHGYGGKKHDRVDPTEEYFTFLPRKTIEIPACGALLLTQNNEDLESMGFRHLENCIIFDHPSEIPGIVEDLLRQDELRQKIAGAGLKLVTEKHSDKIRVQQFTEIVQRELSIC